MAAPNMIGATTIHGKTTGVTLTSNTATLVLDNAASSGKCLKINTLNVANYGNVAVAVTISWYDAADIGGNAYPIVSGASVPVGSTLNIVDKTSQYYLAENQSIGARAGAANSLVITCSYEDIS